jgi:hypothetical protein
MNTAGSGLLLYKKVLLWLALCVAALLGAIWLWCCWCAFPTSACRVFNDLRTAASVGLHLGFSPYSTENAGQITTWIYGPVPLYVLWPAGWARTAAGALEVAGAINLGLIVFGVVAACLHYGGRTSWISAVLVSLFAWPVYTLNTLSSEHVVFAAGMAGMVLMDKGHRRGAALCAVLALFTKQTAFGVGLAQIVWLLVAEGWPAALRHMGRLAAIGAALACLFLVRFHPANLWQCMFVVPGGLPWTPNLRWQLVDGGPYLLAAVAVAVSAAMTCRKGNRLALPALTYLCLFPLAVATDFKFGGSYGAFDVAFLWLAPALALGLGRLGARWPSTVLAGALVAAALGCWRLTRESLDVRPDVEMYREADYLAKGGHVWFPLNPLVTLYSEGRYYHDEDGLNEREVSGHPVTRARLWANLPNDLKRVVYSRTPTGMGIMGWGIAMRETGNVGRGFGLLWFVVECKPPMTTSDPLRLQKLEDARPPAHGL